jgi:nucleotide-binding universal stress UspA family protein
MATILCATRGGEASKRTQDEAIRLAKEQAAQLVFFYVVDVSFLQYTGAHVLVDVDTELEKMGEFLLIMAQERAKEASLDADYVIRRGAFLEELMAAAQELEATLVLLGSPAEEGYFRLEALEALAEKITEETGIPARIF